MNQVDRFTDQVKGAVLGAAIGDAMGHPTEFMSMAQIHEQFGPHGVTDFALFWEREGQRFAPYTDDTQMAEMVLRGLLISRGPRFSLPRDLDRTMTMIAEGFIEWAQEPQGGHRAPGNACMAGCRALARGVPWYQAGGEKAGGCGSVMRAYPFGLVFADRIDLAETLAVEHSRLTHNDPIALAACAAMAVGMVRVMNHAPTDRIAASMIEAAGRYCTVTAEMMAQAAKEAHSGIGPEVTLDRLRGWAAHEAIAAGLYVLLRHPADPRAAILEGANTPGDSDSIATLAGALVGGRVGVQQLPSDWVSNVERSEVLCELAEAIVTDIEMVRPQAPCAPGILRRTYQLDDGDRPASGESDLRGERGKTWDDKVHAFVADFREAFHITPNLLLAAESTWRALDVAATRTGEIAADSNVADDSNVHAGSDGAGSEVAAADASSKQGAFRGETSPVMLSAFEGPDYLLEFCIDGQLAKGALSLVYDADPDGPESVPDKDTPL